jgi:hypothetical protein
MPTIITRGGASANGFGFGGLVVPSLQPFNGFNTPALYNNTSAGASQKTVIWNSTLNNFVSAGYSGTASIPQFAVSSTNTGSAWPTPISVGSVSINSGQLAVNSSGLMVLATYDYNSNYPLYFVGSNGTSWSSNYISTTILTTTTAATVNSSGTFFAFGTKIASPYTGQFFTSSNGSTWSGPTTMGTATAFYPISAVTAPNGNMCVVGSNTNAFPTFSVSTNNGATWTTPATIGSTATNITYAGLAVNSSNQMVWVSSYQSSGGTLAWYSYSSNGGVSWTAPATFSSTKYLMTSVVWDAVSSLWVATGQYYAATPYYPVYSTSSNGTTWTAPAAMNGATGTQYNILSSAINSLGNIVAVGSNSSGFPVFATSN